MKTKLFVSIVLFFFIIVPANGQVDINNNGSFETSDVTVGSDTSSVEGWTFNKDSYLN